MSFAPYNAVVETEFGFMVQFQNRFCTPQWNCELAAQMYLDALIAGTRKPEYEFRVQAPFRGKVVWAEGPV